MTNSATTVFAILLGTFAVALCASSIKDYPRNTSETGNNGGDPTPDRLPIILDRDADNHLTDGNREPNEENSQPNNRWARIEIITAIYTVVTTLILGGAVWQASLTRRAIGPAIAAADAAQGQLEALRDEQRPWIKLTVEKIRGYYVSNYPDPVGTGGMGHNGYVDIVFGMTNVGHSPAFNVRIRPQLWLFLAGSKSVLDEQKRVCEKLRNVANSNDGVTRLIYPGDHITDMDLDGGTGHEVAGTGPSDFSEALKETNAIEQLVYVYGCVDYTLVNTDSSPHHQTGFVFQVVQRVDTDTIDPVIDLKQPYPGENLLLTPYMSGSVRTD